MPLRNMKDGEISSRRDGRKTIRDGGRRAQCHKTRQLVSRRGGEMVSDVTERVEE